MNRTFYAALLCWILMPAAWAWNATGHMLIAQIAYDKLEPQTRIQVEALLGQNFISASVWADDVRAQGDKHMNQWHYINFYFNDKGQIVDKPYAQENVVWAIERSETILKDPKATTIEKKNALRGLLHWVGDVHQPLHTVSRITLAHPQGDRGGALFLLAKNAPSQNLHQFWDRGAGLLPYLKRPLNAQSKQWLARTAQEWQQQYQTSPVETATPMQWAEQSFVLAKENAYTGIKQKTIPNEAYTEKAQAIVQKQIVLAGDRLAAILNNTFN